MQASLSRIAPLPLINSFIYTYLLLRNSAFCFLNERKIGFNTFTTTRCISEVGKRRHYILFSAQAQHVELILNYIKVTTISLKERG